MSGDGIRVKGGKGEGDNGEGEALLALGASLPSSAVQPYFSVLQLQDQGQVEGRERRKGRVEKIKINSTLVTEIEKQKH